MSMPHTHFLFRCQKYYIHRQNPPTHQRGQWKAFSSADYMQRMLTESETISIKLNLQLILVCARISWVKSRGVSMMPMFWHISDICADELPSGLGLQLTSTDGQYQPKEVKCLNVEMKLKRRWHSGGGRVIPPKQTFQGRYADIHGTSSKGLFLLATTTMTTTRATRTTIHTSRSAFSRTA